MFKVVGLKKGRSGKLIGNRHIPAYKWYKRISLYSRSQFTIIVGTFHLRDIVIVLVVASIDYTSSNGISCVGKSCLFQGCCIIVLHESNTYNTYVCVA